MEERPHDVHRPETHGDPQNVNPPPYQPICSPPCSNDLLPNRSSDPSIPGDPPTNTAPLLTKFSYLNIRGLIPQTVPSKVPYINDELDSTSATVIALTETWLNQSHLEAELCVEGYSIFRKDRTRKKAKSGRSSGGVAVYVRDDHALTAESPFSFLNGVIESLGILLPSLNLVLITTYRSPDVNIQNKDGRVNHRSTQKQFRDYLAQLRKFLVSLPSPTPDIVMMGDFNLPHADWITGQCRSGATTDEKEMVSALYNLAIDHFLIQQYDCPTHRAGNTIDLLFSNSSNIIHSIEACPSSVSDHYLMTTSTMYNIPQSINEEPDTNPDEECKSFRSLNFFNETINWDALSKELDNHNWQLEFRKLSPTEMMTSFSSVCLDISSKWIPTRPPKQSHSKIPNQRRSLMRRRTILKKQYVPNRSELRRISILKQLTAIEKELQKSHSNRRLDAEAKAIEKIKTNPKFFFTFARRYSKVKVKVGPLINNAKKLTTAPQEMAEILSEQYSSVFSTPKDEDTPQEANTDDLNIPSLNRINFSDSELAEAINDLASNAAPGPDGFPAILLKKCSAALSPPLARIWRSSLETGEIPIICKSAVITPIHKGKSRAVPKNYRPVALTSHLIKVFEKVLRKHIVDFMTTNILFNSSQHGFRSGRSCLSQLLNHFDKITTELEKGNGVDVIYLDFAKAFDKLDHRVTLNKLRKLGIKGPLGCWIATFLSNRTQTVVVNGKQSTPKTVISGVPQGSVLGPLLFLILIGDIDREVAEAFVSSFADDTRVGKGIATHTDTTHLQCDLNAIYKWSVDNNMMFNSDKFELIRYSNKLSKEVQSETSYLSNNGTNIEEKQHVRDLGITLSNDATFAQHIAERCLLVKSKTAWILRTFQSRDHIPMITLWKTLVLCHLDYCSQLWSPSTAGNIQCLELLQRAFITRIAGMAGLSYWDQLTSLKLYSLERRRDRYQIIYTWRVIEGQVPNLESTPINSIHSDRRGRSCIVPTITSSAPQRIKSIRFASLPFKGPRLFNSLPQNIRNLTNCDVTTFKGALDKFLLTLPDQPLLPSMTHLRVCETNSVVDWVSRCRHTTSPPRPILGHNPQGQSSHDGLLM